MAADRAFADVTRHEPSFETGRATDTVRTQNHSSGGAWRLCTPAFATFPNQTATAY